MKSVNKNPEIEKLLKAVKGLGIFGVIIVLGIFSATGIYVVGTDEQGVVLRFGKHIKTTSAGIHWHIPSPAERVIKVKTTKVYKIEAGFATTNLSSSDRISSNDEDSKMLTGDENLLNVNFAVLYKIRNVSDYLFNMRNQKVMIKDASESVVRQIVGKSTIDQVLTEGKAEIQFEAKIKLQELLDLYDAGVIVTELKLQDVQPPQEVAQSFKDVASAKEDKIRYINEANGYKNEVIPRANGESTKVNNEAIAYKQKRISEAKGDVARFLSLYEKYKLGKEVTRVRLYLETLEKVLPDVDKVIIDQNIKQSLLNIIGKEGVINEKK